MMTVNDACPTSSELWLCSVCYGFYCELANYTNQQYSFSTTVQLYRLATALHCTTESMIIVTVTTMLHSVHTHAYYILIYYC